MMLLTVIFVLLSVDYAHSARCACATTDVHVRSGAGTNYPVYTTLNNGSCLLYKDYTTFSGIPGNYDWANVDYNGHSAWIVSIYVRISSCPQQGQTLNCGVGHHRYSARGTAYYPSNDPIEGGFVDMHGVPLKTLQDFLEGRSTYVSVAMDNRAGIQYGTHVCIPELNKKYHKVIQFRVVDTGSAFYGKGYSRIDICVRTREESYDDTINNHLTLVFP